MGLKWKKMQLETEVHFLNETHQNNYSILKLVKDLRLKASGKCPCTYVGESQSDRRDRRHEMAEFNTSCVTVLSRGS